MILLIMGFPQTKTKPLREWRPLVDWRNLMKIKSIINWLVKPSARANGQYVSLADCNGFVHIAHTVTAAVQKYWKPALAGIGALVLGLLYFATLVGYYVSSPK
ncbi:MAG: hypothetical protein RIT04_589 [Candidatus Parcubacteria bacterium]|jgi:hypothetical protein